ncbi:ABC transporter permease [Salinispira pacifica]|uniref:(GlcNAc)2 ABC transporter, permease component 2 n=1 Tax=Salinispira pacifica TaxID=1307761 RepID=V5WFS8_9SPIO|nr:ABC transporter permease [Salinispira pacifica]AHC14485.1 (GlcNAc)2 ABC transporter, permease component 2 [Salinispira pacifica]
MNFKQTIRRSGVFLRDNPKATTGIFLLTIILVLTMGAPLFTDFDPMFRTQNYRVEPNDEHFLGTTQLGRDVWAQTLYGGRTSLLVGVLAGLIAVSLSTIIGITAGYFGGIVDGIITTGINIIMVIPNIPLLLVLASLMGGVTPVMIAVIIGFTSWAWGARVLRSQTMSIRNREFVYAAETLGETKIRRLFAEVMPNMLSMMSSGFVGTVIYAIMAQATLEFLGFGDLLSVTWGNMLYNADKTAALQVGAWWELLGPCLALIMLGSGLTLINFSIDELSNPKLKAQRIMAGYYKEKKKEERLAERHARRAAANGSVLPTDGGGIKE